MNLIKQIKQHEGFSSTVYQCTEGYDTIGYGFAVKDLYLSKEICNKILKQKISELKLKISQKFDWFKDSPDQVQEVVINMCYQLGVTGVSKFRKAISAMQEGEWSEAADEMLDSLWARQTPNRAKELSDIVRNQVEKISS